MVEYIDSSLFQYGCTLLYGPVLNDNPGWWLLGKMSKRDLNIDIFTQNATGLFACACIAVFPFLVTWMTSLACRIYPPTTIEVVYSIVKYQLLTGLYRQLYSYKCKEHQFPSI